MDSKNQSFIGELARISHDPSPLMLTALVLSAAGLALSVAAAHRQFGIGNDVAALTAVAIGGLLASPLSWTHHWVWCVPAILVLVSRRQWVRAWLFGTFFAAGAKWGVTLQPSQESLTLLQQVACATYVAAGTGLVAMWAFGGPGSQDTPLRRCGRGVARRLSRTWRPSKSGRGVKGEAWFGLVEAKILF